MTTISIVMAISLVLNVFFIWYLRNVLEKLLFVSDSIGGLFDSADVYKNHVQSIYELEMYYGDETLKALIDHTKEFHEEIKEFEHVYSLTDTEYEEGEFNDSDHEDEEEEAT